MQPEAAAAQQSHDAGLARLEGKVEALLASKKDEKPWFLTPAVLISLAAFLMSLGTTAVSAYRTYRQDVELQKSQLRATLLQLSALDIQATDSAIKYKNDPALNNLLSTINAQNSVLARQSLSLVTSLGSSASAVDVGIVAVALMKIGESSSAEKILTDSIERASNVGDYTFVTRTLAGLKAENGDLAGAEKYWTLAMAVFEKFPSESKTDWLINLSHAITKMGWTGALIGRDCTNAKLHMADAEKYLQKLGADAAMLAQRDQLRAGLQQACP